MLATVALDGTHAGTPRWTSANEIFEPRDGWIKPVLRHSLIVQAENDSSAIAEADRWYADIARYVSLAGFILSRAGQRVFARPSGFAE
jgi:hypothetical protein